MDSLEDIVTIPPGLAKVSVVAWFLASVEIPVLFLSLLKSFHKLQIKELLPENKLTS